MSAYRRIIVGAHDSPTSPVAETTAARLAKQLGAELIFIHVSDGTEATNGTGDEVLRAAVERARALDVEAQAEHRTGEAATSIVAAAAELRADLLVIGDHGMGPASRFSIGGIPSPASPSRSGCWSRRCRASASGLILVLIRVGPQTAYAHRARGGCGRGRQACVRRQTADLDRVGANRAIATADKAGVVLQVGHNRRRQQANRPIKEAVESGQLGALLPDIVYHVLLVVALIVGLFVAAPSGTGLRAIESLDVAGIRHPPDALQRPLRQGRPRTAD